MKVDELSQLLDRILDDLSARFIINLPEEELSSVTRICFGLEQAHWFYEDFFRPLYPQLPSFSGEHEAAFDDFLKYKIRVPVRGAIILNKEMDKCLLVKGWKASAGWGFPKGKIDQEEDDADCAVREVREECGFDIKPYLKSNDYVDRVMKEQKIRLYVVSGIPMDTVFEPQTRKEISKIDWFQLDDLPTYKNGELTKEQAKSQKNNKFYMVAPFLVPLRKWIKKNKKTSKKERLAGDQSVSKTSTPVPSMVELLNAESDLESSSNALKLLLGVGNLPSATKEPSVVAGAPTEPPATKIDLASLFQGLPNKHLPQEDSSPKPDKLDLLSLLQKQQIAGSGEPFAHNLPSAGQSDHIQSTYIPSFDNRHHAMDSRSIGTSGIPPWMHDQQRNSSPFSAMSNFSALAGQPPSAIQDGQMQFPMQSAPPPGFFMPGRLNVQHSSPQKSNPNAQSLLAVLKPRAENHQGYPQQTYITSPPAYPDLSTRQRMPIGNRFAPQYASEAPVTNHKQSLLSLLKPAVEQVPQRRSPPPMPVQPNSNGNDAFLMQYLMQASGLDHGQARQR